MQVFELQKEKKRLATEVKAFEEANLPMCSKYPVSPSSIRVWGEKVAHEQRPKVSLGRPVSCWHSSAAIGRGASHMLLACWLHAAAADGRRPR